MKRRDFLRAAGLAGSAWLPWRRSQAADQAAVSLTGSAISLPASDIADLAASLQGDLLLPTSSRYEQARRVWNGSINKHPALIASCVGAADVMRAVNFARDHRLLPAGALRRNHAIAAVELPDGGIRRPAISDRIQALAINSKNSLRGGQPK